MNRNKKKQETKEEEINKVLVELENDPLNLSNKRTCFWLKLNQLLCLSKMQP